MKKLYIILILTVVGYQTSIAQNRDTRQADKHFERLEYVEAIKDYMELVEDNEADDYVYKRLADANYNIYNTREAEKYYAMVVESDMATSEDYFRYAQMLKANQKFEESNEMMREFAQMAPSDERARQFLSNPNYLPRLLEKEEKFTAQRLDINSPYYDYGGFEKGTEFYFTSARDKSNKTFGWTGEPMTDIYVARIENGEILEPEVLKGDVNTKTNEGFVAITADGTRMFFDRQVFDDGDKVQLLSAEFVNGRWKDVETLSFSNPEYNFGHPALSPDGNTLYFVSDMPGGVGEFDIYKVAINEDGSFGEPENLGNRINTPGRENTPYISSTGDLYFSSNGHLGLGGLDVFYAPVEGNGFGSPQNLGKPVNSTGDDLAYNINEETQIGYVSSNRNAGGEDSMAASDDIYRIEQIEPLCELELIANVTDANTNQNISGATVTLYDNDENQIASRTTDYSGSVTFEVDCDRIYVVQVNMDGYESESQTVERTEEESVDVNVALSPIDEIVTPTEVVLNPILFDFDKSNIKAQAAFELDKLVQVMERNPDMEIKVIGHTDNRGSDRYNQQLSDRRAKSAVQYVISKGIDASRISGEGRGESDPKIACGNDCTEEQHQLNRRSEFKIVND